MAASLIASAVPSFAMAKGPSLTEISSYLQGLSTAEGRFRQINPDGTQSTGTFYLHRPGRMRFEYDPPNPAMVVAGGGRLAIFDKKSNHPPHTYPLRQTPLNVFLSRNINLRNSPMVTGHQSKGNQTTVTARDPDHPEYGTIQLVFSSSPTELRQWVITDQSGQHTRIVLGDLTKGKKYSSFLFNVIAIQEKLAR